MASNKGGARPGAGRKKGVPNKNKIEIREKLAKLGCDPIEGMAKIAKEALEEGDRVLAGNMYKELAQYIEPKLKAVEMKVSGDESAPIQIKWAD